MMTTPRSTGASPTCTRCIESYPLVLAVGASAMDAARLAVGALHAEFANPPAPNVIVARGVASSEARAIVELVRATNPALAGWRPNLLREPAGADLARVARERWTTAPAPETSQRFDSVVIPASLQSGVSLLIANAPAAGRQNPVGVLAAFAHPRQRLAVELAHDDAAKMELAIPLLPPLVLLAGEHAGSPVCLAANDLVVAEAAWWAFQTGSDRDRAVRSLAPWQEPTIQRAMDMETGPVSPGQIETRVVAERDMDRARGESLMQQLRERLGLPRANP